MIPKHLQCLCGFVLLSLLLAFSTKTRAQDEPIATFKTSIYETYGSGNSFHITLGMKEKDYVDVDCGFGEFEVEVGQATFVDSLSSIQGTAIPITVSAAGEVKIYGDASKIDYLSVEGCYLREMDISKLTNLEILDASHNELTGLDLTPQTKLQALYLDDNPMKATGLTVGAPKDDLMILEIGRIERMGSFNLSDYPAMQSFDAWGNTALTTLNPTGCKNIKKISLDSCPVESLDVTQNTKLQILNISDSGIKDIDLTHCPDLLQLYASHTSDFLFTDRKMESLDVTKNTNLMYLYCGGNRLRTLDITTLKYLQTLGAQENLLETLDISHNVNLVSVSLQNNYFGFRDLPLPSDDWSEYYYYQRPMPMQKCYAVGTPLDFQKQIKDGTTTTVNVALRTTSQADGNTELVLGEDYTWADGTLTMLKAQKDSIMVTFTNSGFSEYKLQTEWFMVKEADQVGQPSKMISLNMDAKPGDQLTFTIGMLGATAQSPKTVLVDFGDGNRQSFSVQGSTLQEANANVSGLKADYGAVEIYTPEGETIYAFGSKGQKMTSFDASKNDRLGELELSGTSLSDIDLKTNRALRTLTLHGNNLGDFSLEGLDGSYGKTLLSDLDLSGNNITSLQIIEPLVLKHFNASNNKLQELISLKDMDNCETIDISHNLLTTINILNCAALQELHAQDNHITQIQQPENSVLSVVDISMNSYTLANMPSFPTATTFKYAPQRKIEISPKGPGANLSAQYVEKDNATTQFSWYKEDGTPLILGTDYTLEGGITRFQNTEVGRVVCHIEHAAYPQFQGDDVLMTTAIEAAPMPTHVLASFRGDGSAIKFTMTATRSQEAVYVDWDGTQSDLQECPLKKGTYTDFDGQTKAGALAKVYTYAQDAPVSVFGLYGAKLKDVDLSALDQLTTLSVCDAGLTPSDITFPSDRSKIGELKLSGNEFTDFDFTMFPALYWVDLSDNKFETVDFSKAPRLQLVTMNNNLLTSATFQNPMLWSLELSGNKFRSFSFKGIEQVEQVNIFDNCLEEIDTEGLTSLRYLDLSGNRLTFATLPQLASTVMYTYGKQADVEATCQEGKVDLSKEASVGSTATTYRWFLGKPTTNADTGELEGEELYTGDEYTVEGGITTFLSDPGDEVVGVLTNEKFPNLTLYTKALTVTLPTGISAVTKGGNGGIQVQSKNAGELSVTLISTANGTGNATLQVFSIDGTEKASALLNEGETATLSLEKGVYIVKGAGFKAQKVIVR